MPRRWEKGGGGFEMHFCRIRAKENVNGHEEMTGYGKQAQACEYYLVYRVSQSSHAFPRLGKGDYHPGQRPDVLVSQGPYSGSFRVPACLIREHNDSSRHRETSTSPPRQLTTYMTPTPEPAT